MPSLTKEQLHQRARGIKVEVVPGVNDRFILRASYYDERRELIQMGLVGDPNGYADAGDAMRVMWALLDQSPVPENVKRRAVP